MSYLSMPRLTFSGQYQCDVSTVNNDVRHFDNASFEERFQWQSAEDWLGSAIENGWWNPGGTGAFRLVDVTVRRAQTAPNPPPGYPDAAVGLRLVSQAGRSAAKMVDLDPQWQNASIIFGLRVVLTDGQQDYMSALFQAAPFRDLYFMRVHDLGGDGGASAKFTSVLTDIEWSSAADRSPVLQALKAAASANQNKLAVNLMTYGFNGDAGAEAFTFGLVTGTIAPWHAGEPDSFLAGRRFAPAGTGKYLSGFATPEGIGFFDGAVEAIGTDGQAGQVVSLDLSNALPLQDMTGTMRDLGPLSLVVLKKPDTVSADGKVEPGIRQGEAVTSEDAIPIGTIPYLVDGWLARTGGIADFAVPDEAAALLPDHPLALVGTGLDARQRVLIRETNGGYFVRADDFEKRMDTLGGDLAVKTVATLYACRYGRRLAGRALAFQLSKPMPDQGGGSPNAVDQPPAPIPLIGTPADRLRFKTPLTTDAAGTVTIPIYAFDPGNPRGYLDGQIYLLEYTFHGMAGLSPMPVFEQIVAHLRQAFTAAMPPDWETELKPILTQYDNLYPVMGRGLFRLSDPEALKKHANILFLSFGLPIDDPNQMPVTRDLSAQKRRAILTWLAQSIEHPPELPPVAADPVAVPQSELVPDAGPLEPLADADAGAKPSQAVALGQDKGGKAVAVAHSVAARAAQPS